MSDAGEVRAGLLPRDRQERDEAIWRAGVAQGSGRRFQTPVLAFSNPRIVSADEALSLLPAFLRPGVRLLGLPGFLVVERRAGARASRFLARAQRLRCWLWEAGGWPKL